MSNSLACQASEGRQLCGCVFYCHCFCILSGISFLSLDLIGFKFSDRVIQSSGVLEFSTPWRVCFITASGHLNWYDPMCRKQPTFRIAPWEFSLADPYSRSHWHFSFSVTTGTMGDNNSLLFSSFPPPAAPPSLLTNFKLLWLWNGFLNDPWEFPDRTPLEIDVKIRRLKLMLPHCFPSFISCRQPQTTR